MIYKIFPALFLMIVSISTSNLFFSDTSEKKQKLGDKKPLRK
jgi:hypothetical protein